MIAAVAVSLGFALISHCADRLVVSRGEWETVIMLIIFNVCELCSTSSVAGIDPSISHITANGDVCIKDK